MLKAQRLLIWALCLAPSAWGLAGLSAHNPITTKVTWTREISTIFARHCISCHQPGGYGAFPLTTYQAARPWAVAIKEEILAGNMPPWGAAPGVGHFANDRRLTRHEQEVIAAWVDGGAPYAIDARTPTFAAPNSDSELSPRDETTRPLAGSIAIPFAPVAIDDALDRVAGVTLEVPSGTTLTAWTFEPGIRASIERVDLEIGSRWLGSWTPGEWILEFGAGSGVPLAASALFTARIRYREAPAPVVDHSRLRIWITKEPLSKTIREAMVVRSWRATAAVEIIALRPVRDDGEAQVVARFVNGRADAVGRFTSPSRSPHPTYRLARPLALAAGARLETTAPVRVLYSTGATRTVNANVSRRPRR